MPKYFFHIRWQNTLYVDPDGVNLADLSAAVDRANLDAVMVSRWTTAGARNHHWIEIASIAGVTLAIVQLDREPVHPTIGHFVPSIGRLVGPAQFVPALQ